MDRKLARIEDGRVFSINNIKIEVNHLNINYSIHEFNGSELTETGLLKLIEFRSSDESLPYFIVRWDEKNYTIDTDIYNCSKDVRKAFLKKQNGYNGHHTKLLNESPRLFKLEIFLPTLIVFRGTITFNAHRRMTVMDTVHVG
jgi:hypothetical protein